MVVVVICFLVVAIVILFHSTITAALILAVFL